MRRLIGFIFAVMSVVLILSILAGNSGVLSELTDALEGKNLLEYVFAYADLMWDILYKPIVVLLLSLIAMSKFTK